MEGFKIGKIGKLNFGILQSLNLGIELESAIKPINEVREEEGLAPVEWSDQRIGNGE